MHPSIPTFDQQCVNLVKEFEELSLTVYRDLAAHPTVGYGHKVIGTSQKVGDKITQLQADAYLNLDLMIANRAVRTLSEVTLTQNQADAITSFVFNLGQKVFQNSTLLKFLNQGNFTKAADEFLKWDHSNHKVIPGLLLRRETERALFLA